MSEITREEYDKWKKTSTWISNGTHFTSFNGPHEFGDIVCKDGMLYELLYGWYPEEDTDPNAKYKYKTTSWWGIKTLHRAQGQEGEGI